MIRIDALCFSYHRNGEELFDGLSHDFPAGAVTGLTGKSGRGKSTLLYILGLVLRPTSGQVLLDGARVAGESDARRSMRRASAFGFVFQDAVLDSSRTVLDAVVEPALYAGKARREAVPRAMEQLERLGLTERANHRPGEISGGQAQRVALCRALMNNPAVLLADEPTGNLDPDNADAVLEIMSDYAAAGQTVVIATHDPSVVDRCDEVLRL